MVLPLICCRYYNRTPYSGLETHIANSYANSLLQLYRFTPLIRNNALHHTATSCLYDNCLLCEMGFLFDMLEKANGQNCQATNLLKTLSGLSTGKCATQVQKSQVNGHLAASLGLLEEQHPNSPLTVMVQSLNRFLLERVVSDYKLPTQGVYSPMDQTLATVGLETLRCGHCMNEMRKHVTIFYQDLVYPPKVSWKNPGVCGCS